MQRSDKTDDVLKIEYATKGADGVAAWFVKNYKKNSGQGAALLQLMESINEDDALGVLNKVVHALQYCLDISALYKNILDRCSLVSPESLQECVIAINDHKKLLPWIKSLNNSDCLKLLKSIKLPAHTELLKELLYTAYKNNQIIFMLAAYECNLIGKIDPKIQHEIKYFNEMIGKFNSIEDEDYRIFSIKMLYQYYKNFGKIDAQGVALSLAALCEDNKITPPTLLVNGDEKQYFTSLKTAKPPYVERFVYFEDCHWLAGEISVDVDGHMKILLIDSLGTQVIDESGNIHRIIFGNQLLAAAIKFDNNVEIYLSKIPRQNSESGCSIYAIDDIRHLETMPNFINTDKYPRGLFDYLKNHSQPEKLDNKMLVNKANLPLRLMRTMQSKQVLPLMTTSEDSDLPLNKSGITGRRYANNPPRDFLQLNLVLSGTCACLLN